MVIFIPYFLSAGTTWLRTFFSLHHPRNARRLQRPEVVKALLSSEFRFFNACKVVKAISSKNMTFTTKPLWIFNPNNRGCRDGTAILRVALWEFYEGLSNGLDDDDISLIYWGIIKFPYLQIFKNRIRILFMGLLKGF